MKSGVRLERSIHRAYMYTIECKPGLQQSQFVNRKRTRLRISGIIVVMWGGEKRIHLPG